jgi:dTDP-glucose 4,6-dehydratase
MMMKILVTGGCGFIGSAFVRLLCNRGYHPVVIDKLTYAGDIKNLALVKDKFTLYRTDIRNKNYVDTIVKKEKIDTIVNIAAESSVDRSIEDCTPFIETNIHGVKILLDIARKYKIKKFIHISTDEVYGENLKGSFTENSPLNPSNPYAASKAAADCLIKSYVRTYGFPAIIIRPCNNYGFYQHKEKFIPKIIHLILHKKPVPVHGTGKEMREWIWVDDCARGIYTVLQKGKIKEIYNLGSGQEEKNITFILWIKYILRKPLIVGKKVSRPGLDRRYFMDSSKIRKLGWKPEIKFFEGILKTVNFYLFDKN